MCARASGEGGGILRCLFTSRIRRGQEQNSPTYIKFLRLRLAYVGKKALSSGCPVNGKVSCLFNITFNSPCTSLACVHTGRDVLS